MSRRLRVRLLIVLFFFGSCAAVPGQPGRMSALRKRRLQLETTRGYVRDTAYLNVVNQIAFLHANSHPDSALRLLPQNIRYCQDVSYKKGEIEATKLTGTAWMTKGDYQKALEWYRKSYEIATETGYETAIPGIRNNIGLVYMNKGNYSAALEEYYEALKSAEQFGDKFVRASTLNNIAIIHFYQGKLKESAATYRKTLDIAREIGDTIGIILAYNNIAEVNIEQHLLKGALENLNQARPLAILINNPEMLTIVSHTLGSTYFRMDSLDKAATFFRLASSTARDQDYSTSACKALIGLARVYARQARWNDALRTGRDALLQANKMGHTQLQRDANEILSVIYEKTGDGLAALVYYKAFKMYSDSLRNLEGERIATMFDARLSFAKKEEALNHKNLQQQWLIFAALGLLVALVVILLIINKSRQRLNRTYRELQLKNTLIETQREKAEETLTELRATQAQLIQSEKMASLGEITAGIAHEIQNPLNFVNNFSETSIELLEDLRAEIGSGRFDDVSDIAADVIGNLERINQHGKRADSIVKSMLQHSRASAGQREPTDLNALVEEYIQLSYHGLRAKDKLFVAEIEKDFETNMGKVTLSPQDIGRVLLNLFNNAFYAVSQKQRETDGDSFKPKVKVSTRQIGNTVQITVTDNGNGVPERIRDKIFQPFFTTKPTGQGTGLGLSLSYDIITKGYGGTLQVQSIEGEGSEFVVTLENGR